MVGKGEYLFDHLGGFCFIPESIIVAMKLFEMESLLNLRERAKQQFPPWEVILDQTVLDLQP